MLLVSLNFGFLRMTGGTFLSGLEAVGETLEQLWISYNKVDKLGPLAKMIKLKTLYMAHNNVK